jgi:hypothetical protein
VSLLAYALRATSRRAVWAHGAAAATLFWLYRLVTADLAAFGDAPVRWLLMLAGLAAAAYVTRASIRRATAL